MTGEDASEEVGAVWRGCCVAVTASFCYLLDFGSFDLVEQET